MEGERGDREGGEGERLWLGGEGKKIGEEARERERGGEGGREKGREEGEERVKRK